MKAAGRNPGQVSRKAMAALLPGFHPGYEGFDPSGLRGLRFIRATRSGMRATGAFDPGCALETAAVAHYSDRQNLEPYHGLMIEFTASAVARIP